MGEKMNYMRLVDFAGIEQCGPDNRFTQTLIDHTSGGKTCAIHCIQTPVGDGSPDGLHIHEFDQIFYILKGTMSVEIENKEYEVGPGTLVIFPAGVPHRNWNAGREPTVHLTFTTPIPDPNLPFSMPAKA
jgi:mannose-6-phosphate isomerase-like protein (cupin superfamily)